MGAEEREVSILIPAYGRRTMTLGAVRSGLSTAAGEVIVSLDTDAEGLAEALSEIKDRRLKVVIQPRRLGLWPNHLALLKLASLEYVKFLQTDDRILVGGLRRLCEEMRPATAIVSGLPYYRNLETGETWFLESGSLPGRWSSSEYLVRAEVWGNELGRPSYTLMRRHQIPLDESLWQDDISTDWLMNLVAASHGDVAIVARGTVVCGIHSLQEGATQPFDLVIRRLANTLQLLGSYPGKRFRTIASSQAAAVLTMLVRNAIGHIVRGRLPAGRRAMSDLMRIVRMIDVGGFATRGRARILCGAIRVRQVPGRRHPVIQIDEPTGGVS